MLLAARSSSGASAVRQQGLFHTFLPMLEPGSPCFGTLLALDRLRRTAFVGESAGDLTALSQEIPRQLITVQPP